MTSGADRAHAFLVVRPAPGVRAPSILVLSTATWNAYNDWGGPSLYTGGTRVSFERPFAKGFLHKPEPVERKMQREPDREAMHYVEWARTHGLSDWSGGAGWFQYERPFLRWAEANGYALDVATSQDLETHPGSWTAIASSCPSAMTSTGRGGCGKPSTRSPSAGVTRRS